MARLRINLPIPKDTHVVLVAWVHSPQGGSLKGKWLSVGGILGRHSNAKQPEQGISNDIVAPTADWQQVALNFNAISDYDFIDISLSTMAGDAEEGKTEWYSWIDDVQIVIKLRARSEFTRIDKDRVIQSFTLPHGYSASEVKWENVELLDKNNMKFSPVKPKDVAIHGDRVTLTFESAEAAQALQGPNPDDPSSLLSGLIRGQVQHGDFLVPFEVGVGLN